MSVALVETKLEPHPLAERVPPMTPSEYEELVQSIHNNGFNPDEAIVLHEDGILDGRHRYKACDELGVECPTRVYEGDEPASYVLSKNRRRNLTESQRAMLAVDFLPELEREARRRMLAGKKPESLPSGHVAAGLDEPPTGERDRSQESREQAAELTGASGRAVTRAKRVKGADPELAKEVLDGKIKVTTAEKQLIDEGKIVPEAREPRQKKDSPPASKRELNEQTKLVAGITTRAKYITDLKPHIKLEVIKQIPTTEETATWLSQLQESRTVLSRLIGAL